MTESERQRRIIEQELARDPYISSLISDWSRTLAKMVDIMEAEGKELRIGDVIYRRGAKP